MPRRLSRKYQGLSNKSLWFKGLFYHRPKGWKYGTHFSTKKERKKEQVLLYAESHASGPTKKKKKFTYASGINVLN